MTTRAHDNTLLRALWLLSIGFPMSAVARRIGKDASNLTKAVRAVLREDLEHDDPFDVLPHYPSDMRMR